MTTRIETTGEIGFCFGVKRAVDIVEKLAQEQGSIETLGAVVHNRQVQQRLAEHGVKTVDNLDEVRGKNLVTSAHGVSPDVIEESQKRNIDIIDTTCPFVRRAQVTAQKLARSGFFVIVYGEAHHPEVKGILGQTRGKGIATLDGNFLDTLERIPRRLGLLSQTTQMPAKFIEFARSIIDATFTQDSELRLVDTICHDIRQRQAAATSLAKKADLMLVIGSPTSANTRHLAELCAAITQTYLIETAADFQPSWLRDKNYVGITSGTSTDVRTIKKVIARVESLAGG